MKHPMVIKLIMKRYKINRKHVANKLGEKNVDALFDSINNDCFLINRMVAVLDVFGYQLVFQPKGSRTLPEWSYPIRWSDYQIEK